MHPQHNRKTNLNFETFNNLMICLYANTRSTENKEEELQACTWLQGYNVIGITEMWWNGSHNWNVGMDGYKLFRKDRQQKRGVGWGDGLKARLDGALSNLV